MARLYDEAFRWPDVARECRFMLEVCERIGGRSSRVLEVAAGPAAHARWFARATDASMVCAVDLSSEMVEYGLQLAREEGGDLVYVEGDMRCLDECGLEPGSHDLAFCMLDSIAYLTTHRDFDRHLETLATVMRPGGLYFIVASHPRDVLSLEPSTETMWEVALDDRKVRVEFGMATDPPIDPISLVRMTTVRIEAWRGEELCCAVEERSALKSYMYPELCALISRSRFELVQTWGAMREGVALDMSAEAWRMVLLLRLR